MQFLRANTQVKVVIGPVVAVGDGFTPVTTLALNSADEAELLKHDAGSVTDISAATFAAITSADGYYNLTLTTSHTDTEGLLTVLVNDDSLCLPVKQTFMVLAEAAYDSLFVAKDDGFMDVNIKTIGRADTQETEASNLETACANYSATRGLSGTALPAAAADAAGGLPISDAGGLDLDNRMPSPTSITNLNTVFATDFAANYDTTGDCWLVRLDDGVTHGGTSALLRLGSSTSTPALYVTNSGGNVVRFQATGGNGTALKLDADGTGHGLAAVGGASSGDGFNLGGGGGGPAGAGAAINGGLLGNVTGNVSGSVGSVTGAVGSVTGNVGGNVAGSVGSVTGNVGGNVTGSIGSLATQAKADVNAEVDTALTDYDGPTNAEMEARTLVAASYATAANQVTIAGYLDTEIAAILSDVTAIKAKTDQLTFTTANRVDATAITVSDKTGYALSATGLDLVVPADPSAIPALGTASVVTWIGYFGAWTVNEVRSDSDSVDLRNSANNANLASHATSDSGSQFVSGEPA